MSGYDLVDMMYCSVSEVLEIIDFKCVKPFEHSQLLLQIEFVASVKVLMPDDFIKSANAMERQQPEFPPGGCKIPYAL